VSEVMPERWAVSDQSGEPVLKWDEGKRHRCPCCWAVAIDGQRPLKWGVYQCCRCGRRFCSAPWLAGLMPFLGVVCSEHSGRAPEDVSGRFVYRVEPLPSVSGVVKQVDDDGTALVSLSSGGSTWVAACDIEVPG